MLSLCMMVKNEERCLQACLDSVAGVAEEIVIVDTGSSDATASIAKRNGATVIPLDFTFVDFAAARNEAAAHARGQWIFVLDADETLDRSGIPLMEELIAANQNAGYYVSRRNRRGSDEKFTTDYAVRLYPNYRDYRYRGRVHETVDASILAGGGRLHTSEIRIDHHAHADADPAKRRARNTWYIAILKEEIAADPDDDTRLVFLAAEYHQLEMFAEAGAIADQIVRMRPLDARAHLNAGIYDLMYRSDPARARARFSEALRLRPGYPEALSFLESAELR